MSRRWWCTLLVVGPLIGLHVPQLHATDGPYLGAGLGIATVKDNLDTGGSFDSEDGSYKVFAGWRFDLVPVIDLAVEAAYTDFGRPSQVVTASATATSQNVEFKLHGPSVAGLLILPLGPFDVYGKGGAIQWKAERNVAGSITTKSGSDAFYGAGVGFYFWKLAVRAEYERYQIKAVDRVQMFSINALFQF